MEELIAASDAARELGLSESTVRHAIRRGSLKGKLMGHSWMVKRRDVEALYKNNRRVKKGKSAVAE